MNLAAYYATLVILPIVLSSPPYNFNSMLIGPCFLPVAFGGFIASIVGGGLADAAGAKNRAFLRASLIPSTGLAVILMPCAYVAFGWLVQCRVHLAVILVSHFLVGVPHSLYLPAISSYISIMYQQEAGSASAAAQGYLYIGTAISLATTPPIVKAIQVGPLMSIVAGLGLLSYGASALIIAHCARQQRLIGAEAAAPNKDMEDPA
jgi:MFS family permease